MLPTRSRRTCTTVALVLLGAAYWRDHGFDLREYAERNWSTRGPKLAGKLHFFAGDMDDFYLNLAVYQFEESLAGTTSP